MNRIIRVGLVVSSLIVSSAAIADVIPGTYTFVSASATPIWTFGDTHTWGNDINNAGQIAGAFQVGNNERHAFVYDNGNLLDLTYQSGFADSEAYAINNNGEAAGTAYYSDGIARVFHWKSGWGRTMLNGDPPFQGYVWSKYARAINDAGVTVADAIAFSGPPPVECRRPVVQWTSSTAAASLAFCAPSGFTTQGMNNSGTIVGDAVPKMYRWKAGVLSQLPAPPALSGYTIGPWGRAGGVNNADHVVGYHQYVWFAPNSTTPTYLGRGFYWDGVSAQLTLTGAFGEGLHSVANDINAQDIVVGSAGRKTQFGSKYTAATIWHEDFGLKALPSVSGGPPGLTPNSCEARALNDRKGNDLVQVTGFCTVGGVKQAVRWDVTIDWQPQFQL